MVTNLSEAKRVDSEPFGTVQLALLVESPEEAARDRDLDVIRRFVKETR